MDKAECGVLASAGAQWPNCGRSPALHRGLLALGASVAIMAGPALAQDISVSYGSPKEDFIAALADMRPMRLQLGNSVSPTSLTAKSDIAFAEYIEEYSGGKLTVEILWANAAATLVDMADKVEAGFVHVGGFGPYYHPDEFPIGGVLGGMLTAPVMGGSPVAGFLVSQAASLEVSFLPEYYAEMTRRDALVPLTPGLLSFPNTVLCKGAAGSDTAGIVNRQIGATTTGQAVELAALGARPVSAPIMEIYQQVDRGVMDCMAGSVGLMSAIGLIDISNFWTFDPSTSFSSVPSAYVFSKRTWDGLPLAARQVIFDAAIHRLGVQTAVSWETWHEQITRANERGVEIVSFSDEIREKLRAFQAQQIEEIAAGNVPATRALSDPAATVAETRAIIEKWRGIIADLGYTDDLDWADFPEWYEAGAADVGPWTQAVAEEIMLPRRPE